MFNMHFIINIRVANEMYLFQERPSKGKLSGMFSSYVTFSLTYSYFVLFLTFFASTFYYDLLMFSRQLLFDFKKMFSYILEWFMADKKPPVGGFQLNRRTE